MKAASFDPRPRGAFRPVIRSTVTVLDMLKASIIAEMCGGESRHLVLQVPELSIKGWAIDELRAIVVSGEQS